MVCAASAGVAASASAAVRNGGHLARARAVKASSYHYNLPKERIASRPVAQRSASKLLVVGGASPYAPDATQHCSFRDLPGLLPGGSRLVMNSSRVIRARIPMSKASGGRAELLLLSPADGSDPTPRLAAPLADGAAWKAFIGGRRVRAGDVLHAAVPGCELRATVQSRDGAAAVVRFEGSAPALGSALDALGRTPLPPYMDRDADAADAGAYQTVYADRAGSVAAPTAGLHITDEILSALAQRGVDVTRVLLHVSAGTFLPMGGETAGEHSMHEERFHMGTPELREIADDVERKQPVVAVGTTSVRTLESIYWHGVRVLRSSAPSRLLTDGGDCFVGQWEPYEALDMPASLPPTGEALRAAADAADAAGLPGVSGITKLLIVPGYPFQTIDGLLTNFHQPASTLLMLVAAFAGGRAPLIRAYDAALSRDYRFLSYGDSSLYFRPPSSSC